MRRRPGVLSYPPGAVARLLGELGATLEGLRPETRKLALRADQGAPLVRVEAARLEKALLSIALGTERIDHRSGAYGRAKALIRSRLPVCR